MKDKLMIIGFDGATPKLIQKWLKDLPNIKKLIRKGAYGVLNSSIPPFSCPAWNCFMTGKNPGKMGVFDFQVGLSQFDINAPPKIVNLTYQDSLTFWEILGFENFKTGIVNVPLTYPPPELNGFMVSGYLTPPDATDFTYPLILKNEIRKIVPDYDPTEYSEITSPGLMKGGKKGFVNENKRALYNTSRIVEYLIKNKEWDIFNAVFTPLDRLQHYFWHYMDSEHPKFKNEEINKYENVIKNEYIRLDKILGGILKLTDLENTNVILMSDHGFGPAHGYCRLNNFLRDRGYLKLKRNSKNSSLFQNILKKPEKLLKIIAKTGIMDLKLVKKAILSEKSFLRKFTPNSIKLKHPYTRSRSQMSIDWNNTLAYAFGNNKIYINLKGRESQGTVEEGEEYNELIKKLKRDLYNIREPDTGEKIVKKIYEKDEIYEGKYINQAPDIVLEGDLISFRMGTGKEEIFEKPALQSGDHRQEGIIIMKGPDIKNNQNIYANIMDIAPTVLYMFNIPIPEDMDGKIIKSALNLNHNPVYRKPFEKKRQMKEFTREENKELKKQLEHLGYI